MKKDLEKKFFFTVEKRNITGKKVKQLRRKGIIPGNIFGSNFKSISISFNEKDFKKNYKLIKKMPFFYIKLDNNQFPVIIHQIQTHPVTDQLLHVDFRKIDLEEKIEVEVPLKMRGKSEAVEVKGGVLLQQKDKLTIKCLPKNIPSFIEININNLKEIGEEIKVKDLLKSAQYEIKEEPETVIVSVVAHKEEKITPEQPVGGAQPEAQPEEGKESNIKTEESSPKK